MPVVPSLPPSALPLVETVERDVPGMTRCARSLTRRFAVEIPLFSRSASSATQKGEVDDAARTENTNRVRIEDSARHEMELEGAVLVDDRVAGIVSAWNRMTTSASCARRSVIFPLPSSPH